MFPKLISSGSFFIPTYGTLVAIGFLVALWVIVRLAKRAGMPSEKVTNLAIYCALAGLAGAKLFMILFDFQTYWNDPKSLFSLSTLQAAGVYQGGFLVALRNRHSVHAAPSICLSLPPAICSRPASRLAKPSAASDVFPLAAAGASRRMCPGP